MDHSVILDDRLVSEAKRVGHHKTETDAVTAALQEYITRRQQARVIQLFGAIDYEPDYDYKAQRRRE